MKKFYTLEEIIKYSEEQKISIGQTALKISSIYYEKPEKEVFEKMSAMYQVMREAVHEGCRQDLKSLSGLTGGMAFKMKQYVERKENFSQNFMGNIIYRALAVAELNAAMGKIVAAPTAGSCGILPACLTSLEDIYHIDREKIIMALLNASAVGDIIAENASISGAYGGCQAECGSASAMAASAMTEAMGGSPAACGHAAALALKSLLGLVCDPVLGLVEEPCIIRNANSASIAVCSAEMSLAGIKSIIPVDQVINAMKEIGEQMSPSLKETAEGGLANTPCARALHIL